MFWVMRKAAGSASADHVSFDDEDAAKGYAAAQWRETREPHIIRNVASGMAYDWPPRSDPDVID